MPVPQNIKLSSETAMRFKLEAAYAEDSAPTITDNLVRVLSGLSYTRLAGSRAQDERQDPYLGSKGELKGSHYAELGFSTYVNGVAAGDAPDIDAMLQACGFASVVTAGDNVTYNPVQADYESGTGWVDMAGELHKIIGARGSVEFAGTLGEPLKANWTFKALNGADPANVNFPAISAEHSCVPALAGDNLTASLDGVDLDVNAFSINTGVETVYLDTSRGKSIRVGARSITGSLTVIKPELSYFDYRAKELDPCSVMPLVITHNGIEYSCASTSMGITTDTDINGVAAIQIPLVLKRTNGNDDLLIKFGAAA